MFMSTRLIRSERWEERDVVSWSILELVLKMLIS